MGRRNTAPNPEPSLYEIGQVIGRVESKLDTLLTTCPHRLKQTEAIAGRVTALETQRTWLVGAVVGLSLAAGLMWDWLKYKLFT